MSTPSPPRRPIAIAVAGDITEPMTATLRASRTFKEAKELWIEQFERQYLEQLLGRNRNSLSAAAREADLDRKYLRKLVRKYGIGESTKETE